MTDYLPSYAFYDGAPAVIPVAHAANTLTRLEQAAGLGYQYVEIDVATTADEVPVAIHGPKLWQRPGPQSPRLSVIEEMTLEEVQGKAPGTVSSEELITTFPDLRFFVDVKTARSVRPLSALITKLALHDRLSIAGSNYAYPSAVKEQVGRDGFICTTLGTFGGSIALAATRLRLGAVEEHLRSIGATEFALPVVLPTTTKRAHSLGMRVFTWTPNTKKAISGSIDKGVDGIISDEFALLMGLAGQSAGNDGRR